MRGADQSGFVRIVANRANLGFDLGILQQNRGAADGELADAAAGKSAAEHDPLGILPGLELEKPAEHAGELLRKGFDRALHHAGRFDLAFGEKIIKLLFGDFARLFVAEWILPEPAQRFAPLIDEMAKRALARTIADEAVSVLELDVVANHLDARKPPSAV